MEPTVGPSIPLTLAPFATIVPVENIIAVIFTVVFIWWAIFTVVLTYHWFRYARDTWVAVPVVALHFVVSGSIFVFSTGGFN